MAGKKNSAKAEAPGPDAPPAAVASPSSDAGLSGSTAESQAPVKHLTRAERVALGKAARSQAPLESHAEWTPPPNRADPVTLLEAQAKSRVAELVPIRYGRMMGSPFAFYRGGAYIMASDLASTLRSGLRVQACGDAHLVNFGTFASPERALVFDINDFDETLPGPWEWDVKRLAASFEVAMRGRGFSDKDRRAIVLQMVGSYRNAMREFAGMKNLEVWYARLDVNALAQQMRKHVDSAVAKRVDRQLAKFREKDSTRAFAKLTVAVEGRPRIVADSPLIVPLADLVTEAERDHTLAAIRVVIRGYRRSLQSDRRHLLEGYELVDLARKVVGVGSVGLRANVALLLGSDDQDPLFIQIKEAEDSVLAPYVGKSLQKNQGQRVVEGQRLMQAASDIFLGWTRVADADGVQRDYYMRQLWDQKGSADLDTLLPQGFKVYASMCGWTLARAHARSGDRIAIASYLGKRDVFDNAIADFSTAYADQNEQDYQALVAAVKGGRIQALEGL
jgi:uncharacterized protein (DUF2252 family)